MACRPLPYMEKGESGTARLWTFLLSLLRGLSTITIIIWSKERVELRGCGHLPFPFPRPVDYDVYDGTG